MKTKLVGSLLAGTLAIACAVTDSNEDGVVADAITDTDPTSVKNQGGVGFCWIYTTIAWAEGLHQVATGEAIDFAEGYVGYWYWFLEIARPEIFEADAGRVLEKRCPKDRNAPVCSKPSGTACELSPRQGGYFDYARFLISRFGLMTEEAFGGDGFADGGVRALNRIRASLTGGALRTPRARQDEALVRRELDRAFGLSAETVASMNAAFGEGGPVLRSLDRSVGPVRAAADVEVFVKGPSAPGPDRATLGDLLGEGEITAPRTGPLAWHEFRYPAEPKARRVMLHRAQRALHDRQALPIIYWNERNALDRAASVFSLARVKEQGAGAVRGTHAVLVTDYEVANVPGFGTLKAGTLESRPEALAAALDGRARIAFLRVKNSWGSDALATGFYDLEMPYLDGPLPTTNTGACADGRPVATPSAALAWIALPAGY